MHAPALLEETLGARACQGLYRDPSTQAAVTVQPATASRPPLHTLISAHDFTHAASRTLSAKAWAFYSSAATDLVTRDANADFFSRIWFRPRILRNVRTASTRTRILGCDVSMPLMVAPTAVAKMAHPEGEKALARAAASKGIIQCVGSLIFVLNPSPWLTRRQISSNASFPLASILPAAPVGYPFFFQLYVNSSRAATETLLAQVVAAGVKAIFLTVDAPIAGKREADERLAADPAVVAPMTGGAAGNDAKGGGMGRLMGAYVDASLSWDDLAWVRSCTGLPLVLKGIQTAADARKAMRYGVQGIVVSNHGGRSLDTSSPALLVLLELRRECPEVFARMEVYIDGGVRRGSDILKAVCLGATAVGVGRPFLYALTYGAEGVERLVDGKRLSERPCAIHDPWLHRLTDRGSPAG